MSNRKMITQVLCEWMDVHRSLLTDSAAAEMEDLIVHVAVLEVGYDGATLFYRNRNQQPAAQTHFQFLPRQA